ncbi:MAG: O-antigen ligase [Bacteroidia bacterium]
MVNKLNTQQKLHFVPLFITLQALVFSPAVVSIGLTTMLLSILADVWLGHFSKARFQPVVIILAILFGMLLLEVFRGDFDQLSKEWLLKLPLLIVPIYMLRFKNTSYQSREFHFIILSFVITITAVAVVSVVSYFLHFEQINEQLLHSKHIPILAKVHHIYFGITLAVTCWTSAYFSRRSSYTALWIVLLIIQIICLHILVSRTGLLSFYASGFAILFWYIFKTGRVKVVGVSVLIFSGLVLLFYQFSPGFQNKFTNTKEDFNATLSGQDINYKSMAMRIEAYKTTWHFARENWIFGVGSVGFEQALQKQYEDDNTTLYPENRIGPHNQFLESFAKHGFVAPLLLLILCVIGLVKGWNNSYLLAITVVFATSFLLESVLERQMGMVLFGVFLLLGFNDKPDKIGKKFTDIKINR